MVDWQKGSKMPNFANALTNLQMVCDVLAAYIWKLKQLFNYQSLEKFSIIGHGGWTQVVKSIFMEYVDLICFLVLLIDAATGLVAVYSSTKTKIYLQCYK